MSELSTPPDVSTSSIHPDLTTSSATAPASESPARATSSVPWSAVEEAVPLVDPAGPMAERIAGLGARQVNLYRSLAHAPDLLEGWMEFAWALRPRCTTPRPLRELMILRTAVVMRSEYEWHQHRIMAIESGVPNEQIEALAAWQVSDLFDPRERAALMLTDAILTGHVTDAVQHELSRHFSAQERVELVMTAGFYAMVPRVLDALRVPIEGAEDRRN